ncbi:MAG: hypothetical protein H0V54_02535 [Chthoniobacterales bacterium]|nr:hypothetical protein [Chthoniobacterales bacterium]
MSRDFLRGPDLFRGRKQVFDDGIAPNQSGAMKYLPHLLLATATALSLASCAAPGDAGVSAGTQLGPHSAQKFALTTRLGARTLNENDPNFVRTLALVLTVEQSMNGNQQQITAKASARKDGPTGSLLDARGIQVRLLQPVQMESKLRTEPGAGELNVTSSVSAPGGKYRTVVAEASINNSDYSPKTVSLTIPGDQ